MRNYVIINGKNSRTVHGLLISELPPIVKPTMRTAHTEVDGADGDVIETLGFSAYDRQMTIGLYGDYDVDEVIEFFNTSGEVIFSNEPEKVYTFGIYNEISFERLVRFKTAVVTFHVQPFKHYADEPVILWSNAAAGTFKNFDVKNIGNVVSRPTIEIAGQGEIRVLFNDKYMFDLNLDETAYAIIDCEKMNVYDENGNFLNRKTTGDISKMTLNTGLNSVRIGGGTILQVKITNYTRWI